MRLLLFVFEPRGTCGASATDAPQWACVVVVAGPTHVAGALHRGRILEHGERGHDGVAMWSEEVDLRPPLEKKVRVAGRPDLLLVVHAYLDAARH